MILKDFYLSSLDFFVISIHSGLQGAIEYFLISQKSPFIFPILLPANDVAFRLNLEKHLQVLAESFWLHHPYLKDTCFDMNVYIIFTRVLTALRTTSMKITIENY